MRSAAAGPRYLAKIVLIALLAMLPWSASLFGETDFVVPPGRAPLPFVITVGPDRNVWFTENTGLKIGTISAAGVLSEFPIPGAQGLCGITTGPDRNLWFTDEFAGFIGHIGTDGSNLVTYSLPGSMPQGIVTGPDNRSWFVDAAVDPQNPANGFRIGAIDASGNVTEYPTGINPGIVNPLNYAPGQIAVGSDGNLWFTNANARAVGQNIVGRITTSGSVTIFNTGDTPQGIAAGPDGNLWVIEYFHVARIDTSGGETELPLTEDNGYSGITTGLDGNIWFTEFQTVGFVNPSTLLVTELPLNEFSNFFYLSSITSGPRKDLTFVGSITGNIGTLALSGQLTGTFNLVLGSFPSSNTLGPDGNIWVTQYIADSVSRVTTTGHVTSFPTPQGSNVGFIVTGSDGNLWVTEQGSSQIAKINTSGQILAQYQASGLLWSLTLGPDGNIWFPERFAGGNTKDAIARITPSGVLTEFTQGLTPGAGALYITPGPDGNLWFTENFTNKIGKINPSTGQITEFSNAGSLQPSAIVTGPDNKLWVMDAIPGAPPNAPQTAIAKFSTSGSLLANYPVEFTPLLDIKPGPDGALWFPQYYPNGIGRITTSGVVSTMPLTAVNAEGNDVAFGSDHKLWIAEVSAGVVGRLSAIGGTGNTIMAQENLPFNGAVATFVDGTPSDLPSQFTATIDWGDGTRHSAGTVSGPEGGPFTVSGTHIYAAQGTYTLEVNLHDTVDNATYPASPGSAQVNLVSTSTSLASSPNPSTYLQLVTFTATVMSITGAPPGGTVMFTSDGTVISGCAAMPLMVINGNDVAQCPTASLPVGNNTIVASYSGNSQFAPSQSPQFTQTLNQAATTTVITANPPGPSNYGTTITFTATVTGANGGSPTGTVSFTDGTNPIAGCTGVALVPQANGSTATCSTSTLAVGQHTISGAYSGDSNFLAGSGSVPYRIIQGVTAAVLTVNPSSATAGQVVTLTATVTSDGGPVPNGTVTFSSASATLGTVQIVMASGTATLKTRFAPGSYSLTARYNGTDTYFACRSMSELLTVTGTESTISTLTETSDGSNYDFSLSVFGFGFTPLSGSATLNNLTQGGTLLGTISVPGPGMSTFQAQTPYSTAGSPPAGVAVADLNGDGILDLIVTNYNFSGSGNTFSVLLGKPDGSFQAPSPVNTGLGSVGVAVGDFDGDGKLDVAIANSGSNAVGVLLGNGHGGFGPETDYPTGDGPVGVVVADFNGDGRPDLAVTNYNGGTGTTVSVFMGNGDGTFQQPPQTYATGNGPYGIVAADFNGDGLPDLAVVNNVDGTVSILLNSGNGTFQVGNTYSVGSGPLEIVAADFKGDGIQDLAVTNSGNDTVSVLIGNGDGTFQQHVDYPTGVGPYDIVVADFNGDHIPDLATSNETGNDLSILIGDGQGGFAMPQPYPVGTQPLFLAAADFNGDGVPDLAASNFNGGNGNTASVLLGGTVSTGTLNNIPVYGSGNQNIQASFAPTGSFYAGGQSNQVTIAGELIPTTTVVTSSLNPSSYLHQVTFTATVTSATGAPPTGTATFTADGNTICSAVPLVSGSNGSTAMCLNATLTAGQHSIVASYSGGGNFAASQSQPLTQTVNKAATSAALTSAPNPSTYLQTVTITATVTGANGGSPTGTVSFADSGTVISGCGSVALTAQRNGSVATCQTSSLAVATHSQIVGTYSGDGNYNGSNATLRPAQVVNKAATTAALTSSPNPSTYLETVTITATVTGANGGSPTGTVSFTDSGTVISGCGAVTLTAQHNGSVATCQTSTLAVASHSQIVGTYGGDNNYSGTNSTLQPAQVVNPAPTLTVITANPPSPSNYGTRVTFTATVTGANGGSPAGTVNFTDGTNPLSGCTGVALVPQTTGSLATCQTSTLAGGAHNIGALYSGSNSFVNSGGSIQYIVMAASSSVALSVTPSTASAGQVVTLTATVTSGGTPVPVGTVTFLRGTEPLGTVQLVMLNGMATLRTRFAPGSYSLAALYNGTSSFSPGVSSPQPLNVTGTEPTISTLSATPDGSNYDFSLSVFGFGFPLLSGSATVNNLTQGGTLVGNITLPGPDMLGFQSANVYPTGNFSIAIATGDFNGDGFIDLAVVNQTDNTVSVLLGNRDGTFRAPQTYPLANGAGGIAVGDFNGDGKLDLAVACAGGSNGGVVSVLLGNGDGTFQAQRTYAVGFFAFAVAVGDFNLDGSPDLVASGSNGTGGAVVVLLNNGDGTFTAQRTSPAGMSGQAVAVGDFNHDGRLDVAVADFSGNQAVVLLGDGQGGFSPAQTYLAGNSPSDVAVADLNHDGNLDLALTNQGDNTVSVLLGKGDGTFHAQHAFAAGQMPVGIGIADFTGSGTPDLAVASSGDNTVRVLLGNGDGTFRPQLTFPSGGASLGLAIADFNGDGFPDLATANYTSNDASVLIGGTVSSGQLLNAHVTGTGNQNIQSNFTPSGTLYAGSLSNVVTVIGIPQTPTTTVLVSSQNPSRLGQPVTFTATVTSSPLPPSGNVTFTSNGMMISACPNPVPLMLVGTLMKASCTTHSLPAGADTILAAFNDPQHVFGSSSASLTQTVQTGAGDFQISLNTPNAITVTQGYSNATDPFFPHTVQVTVAPVNGYSGTVTLSCSVSPPLSGGSCTVNAPTSGLVDANLVTTLTISAGTETPVGQYMITVSGNDENGGMHQINQNLIVINSAPGIMETKGGGGSTKVYFPGDPGTIIGNFSCPLVSGTGLTGQQPLSTIGGNCTFTPTSGTIPGPIMVTIYGCTVARLHTHIPIYATLFFGLPGVVLLGPLAAGRRRRKRLLQAIGIFLVLCAMLLGVGCGGYGQLTPTGNYQVLVQGTSPGGTVYSAVVPVTVTPLH